MPIEVRVDQAYRVGIGDVGLGARIEGRGSLEHLTWRPREEEIFQSVHLTEK